ncbi:MAG: DotD/TraH family lipoprotein [Bdellovibrionales bacterium]
MKRSNVMILVSGAAILLAGCSDIRAGWDSVFSSDSSSASAMPETAPVVPLEGAVATEPDIVSVKLAQAADKAAKALDAIANIEQHKNPSIAPMQIDYARASPNMMQPVSLRWSGPIEQVSRVLAEKAGMRFRVVGRTPQIPLVVNVDAYRQPILNILRDIGLQAGARADLSIDQNIGVVEVRYAAADQSR